MTDTPRLILEVSGPRMGTTVLHHVLSGHRNFVSLGECFHQGSKDGPSEVMDRVISLSRSSGLPEVERGRSVVQFFKTNPVKALRLSAEAVRSMGGTVYLAKVGIGNLSMGQLNTILREFRPIGLLVRRNPVDQYVSREKALSLRQWVGADTTAVKADLSPEAFIAWRRRQQNHFRMGRYLFERHGLNFAILDYEELFGKDDDRLEERVAQAFQSLGIDLGARKTDSAVIPRQDRNKSVSEKVANWEAFHTAVSARLPGFVTMPYDTHGNKLALQLQFLAESLLSQGSLRRIAQVIGMSGTAR